MSTEASTQIDNSVAVLGAGADGPRHRGGLRTGIIEMEKLMLDFARHPLS